MKGRQATRRIAMIGPFGLTPKGTMSARALPLARELTAVGHQVRVIMPPWHTPGERSRCWEEAGVSIEYVARRPRVPLLSHLILTIELVGRALAWKPDVVHCFKPKGYSGLSGWLLWLLTQLKLARVRLVIDEDDWEGPGGWNEIEPYRWPLKKVFAWQERWGLRHNDGVTVASRTLESLVWALGVIPRKTHYLPNGTDAQRVGDGADLRTRYGLGDSPVVLLYTRFFEYDVARAIIVFQRVLAGVPSARLLVVGKGLFVQQEERFDRLAVESGLADHIVRAGWVSKESLPDYFAAADVAIYPFDDTLVNRAKCPAKLVDLLAAGLPVVADAVGQNREYIRHGETGLLVPSGDAAAMASATLRLLRDESWRQALGSAAREHILQHFNWRVLATDLVAAYQG